MQRNIKGCLKILHLLLITNGVFGVETTDLSVTQGESVTLHTGAEKQKDDLIVWYFGPANTLVARINGKANSTTIDDLYLGRAQVDKETSSLTITNIRTTDSGLYLLKISRKNKVSYKKFNVTVYGKSLLSSISVSLPLEVENKDNNTHSCVNNTFGKQTHHLDISDLCTNSSFRPTRMIPVLISAVVVLIIIALGMVTYSTLENTGENISKDKKLLLEKLWMLLSHMSTPWKSAATTTKRNAKNHLLENTSKQKGAKSSEVSNAVLMETLVDRFDQQDGELSNVERKITENSIMIVNLTKSVEFNTAEIKDCKDEINLLDNLPPSAPRMKSATNADGTSE